MSALESRSSITVGIPGSQFAGKTGEQGCEVKAEILIGIVDDDHSLRNSLARLVRSMGHEARGFCSAEELLQSQFVERCSCVITDVQMTGMSGIELTAIITAEHNALPVIVITARSEPGLEEKALESGATCFLRKPIDAELLVAKLSAALQF